MKTLTALTILALVPLPLGAQENNSCHGTAINFISTPREAAKVAAKERKLVCILHVSGHFEDPNFT